MARTSRQEISKEVGDLNTIKQLDLVDIYIKNTPPDKSRIYSLLKYTRNVLKARPYARV